MAKSAVFFYVEKSLLSNNLDFINFPHICKMAPKLPFWYWMKPNFTLWTFRDE